MSKFSNAWKNAANIAGIQSSTKAAEAIRRAVSGDSSQGMYSEPIPVQGYGAPASFGRAQAQAQAKPAAWIRDSALQRRKEREEAGQPNPRFLDGVRSPSIFDIMAEDPGYFVKPNSVGPWDQVGNHFNHPEAFYGSPPLWITQSGENWVSDLDAEFPNGFMGTMTTDEAVAYGLEHPGQNIEVWPLQATPAFNPFYTSQHLTSPNSNAGGVLESPYYISPHPVGKKRNAFRDAARNGVRNGRIAYNDMELQEALNGSEPLGFTSRSRS